MQQPAKPRIEFWYEFASTYSYLSAMRISNLAQAAGVEVKWRPFLLGPIFHAQGWDNSPFNLYPDKGRYMWRDMERLCHQLGLAFQRPKNFPANGLLAARVALVGANQGWIAAFSREIYVQQFTHGRDISQPQLIEAVLAGLDLPIAQTLELAGTAAIKDQLRKQTEKAQQLRIFGAPSFTTKDGELFWGNDRLEDALHWLKTDKCFY